VTTANRHCDGVRRAHQQAVAGFPQLDPHDLQCAVALANKAGEYLREAYKLVRPHATLASACETAGKSVRQLKTSLVFRMEGRAP